MFNTISLEEERKTNHVKTNLTYFEHQKCLICLDSSVILRYHFSSLFHWSGSLNWTHLEYYLDDRSKEESITFQWHHLGICVNVTCSGHYWMINRTFSKDSFSFYLFSILSCVANIIDLTQQDGRMTKTCRARLCIPPLARHIFVILPP